MGVMTLILKGQICAMRKIRNKEDWANSFFSGLISGYLSIFFIREKSRLTFATFFLSRAFDCVYNSMVKRKIINNSKYNYVIIFLLMNLLTVYARFHEPYLVPKSLSKFYEFVYQKGPLEGQLEHVLTEMTKRRRIRNNIIG